MLNMSNAVYVYLDNNIVSDVCFDQGTSAASKRLVTYLLRARKFHPAVSTYGRAESDQGKKPDRVECRAHWYDLLAASGELFHADAHIDALGEALWRSLGWAVHERSKDEKKAKKSRALRFDALHTVCAACNQAGYFVTWDSDILGSTSPAICQFLADNGLRAPQFHTPSTFMGVVENPRRAVRSAGLAEANRCRVRLAERGGSFKAMCAMIRREYEGE